jgi:hypothetical protein
MEYPIKVKECLYGGKVWESDLPDELEERGYPEEMIEKVLPRYLVYELELDVEIDEDGNTTITHVAGQKLPTPITNA